MHFSLTHSLSRLEKVFAASDYFFAGQKSGLSARIHRPLRSTYYMTGLYEMYLRIFADCVYYISRSIYAPKIILRLTFNPLLHAPHFTMKLIIVKAVSFLVAQQLYRYGYSCRKTRFNSVFFSISVAGKTKKKPFIVVRGKLENLGQRNDEVLTS